jgi:hypothetical protein
MEQDDVFYRPKIEKPDREVTYEQTDPEKYIEIKRTAERLNVSVEDIPSNPFVSMRDRFKELETIAIELKDRCVFLLDKTIKDLDGYVGEAPPHILKYIEDLTGISFKQPQHPADLGQDEEEENTPYPILPDFPFLPTDDIFTLPENILNCIFDIAGFFDPDQVDESIHDPVKDFDSEGVKKAMSDNIKDSFLDPISIGLKLLVIVLKMSHVIAVHYTIGYLCGFIKKWKLKFKVPGKKIKIKIGKKISKKVFKPFEKKLLNVVGYKCKAEGEPIPDCEQPSGEGIDFKVVNCCTMRPIFFGSDAVTGSPVFTMSKCFEQWIDEEINEQHATKGLICSMKNADSRDRKATPAEKAKAKEVANYLLNGKSSSGVTSPSDVYPLSKGIDGASSAIEMAASASEVLTKVEKDAGEVSDSDKWDCFGLGYNAKEGLSQEELANRINDASGKWMGTDDKTGWFMDGVAIYEPGVYLFEYLKGVDDAIVNVLKLADKVVIGAANLSKWGTSRQLCCWVYLMVVISSMVSNIIKKKSVCPNIEYADAFREEMRWASNLHNNQEVKKFVKILEVLKQIIDTFRKQMDRSIFLAGLTLPLKEMWELIKMTISNGIAQYMDIIFGPINTSLDSVTKIPEIRSLIVNECFGADELFGFLKCLLGNLKFGMVNWVAQFMDFTIKDFVLINDIYLSRSRLVMLDSLSELLDSMINMILGLADCYEPKDLPDQIADQQLLVQQRKVKLFAEVAGDLDSVKRYDECSKSIMDQKFIPDEKEIEEIESNQNGLSSSFGKLGNISLSIMKSEVTTSSIKQDRENANEEQKPSEIIDNMIGSSFVPIEIAQFLDEDGEIVSPAEFKILIEKLTGIMDVDIRESMRHIFDTIKG